MEFFGKVFKGMLMGSWSISEDHITVGVQEIEFSSLLSAPVMAAVPSNPLQNGIIEIQVPGKKLGMRLGYSYGDREIASEAFEYMLQAYKEQLESKRPEGSIMYMTDRAGSSIALYDDYLELEKRALRWVDIDDPSTGVKRIDYRDITSVTVREPDFHSGYLQISYPGSVEAKSTRPGGNLDDENTIMVGKNDIELARKIAAFIEQRRAELRKESQGSTVIQASPADELRKFMFEHVYYAAVTNREKDKACHIIEFLFTHYMQNKELMPPLYIRIAEEDGLETAVCDFISCMTDEYAIDLFKELCIPKQWIRI